MTLNTDWTTTDFNSYATLLELDDFALDISPVRATDKWDALTDTEKESYAKEATKWLTQFNYVGELIADVIAPLAMWPREYVTYPNGVAVEADMVPEAIKSVQFTRCLDMLDGIAVSHESTGVGTGQIKRQKLEGLEQEFFQETSKSATFETETKQSDAYRALEWVLIPETNNLIRV